MMVVINGIVYEIECFRKKKVVVRRGPTKTAYRRGTGRSRKR